MFLASVAQCDACNLVHLIYRPRLLRRIEQRGTSLDPISPAPPITSIFMWTS